MCLTSLSTISGCERTVADNSSGFFCSKCTVTLEKKLSGIRRISGKGW